MIDDPGTTQRAAEAEPVVEVEEEPGTLDPSKELDGASLRPPLPEGEGEAHPTLKTMADGVSPALPPARGRLKTWVIASLVCVALAVVAYASTFTALFAAREIRVEGTDHLSVDRVRVIAKIQPGVNVFRLDTAKAIRRLERNAWVADAEVTKDLPSGVLIVLRERTPAAVVVTDASGTLSLVAGDGTVLAVAGGPVGFPLVRLAEAATPPSETQRTLGSMVAASIPRSIAGAVEAVEVASDGSVRLALRGGVVVSYGDATALDAKGQALRAVLLWAERSQVRLATIDVRTPGAPTAARATGTTVTPKI
ncbi:MAG: FtsQ-type POTRA domain-containing protein [Actinomycetota bacterium]